MQEAIDWKKMDRTEAHKAFFNGEIYLRGWDMSGGKELVIKYEPNEFLFHIDEKEQIKENKRE